MRGLGRHIRGEGVYCVGNFITDLHLRGYGKLMYKDKDVVEG